MKAVIGSQYGDEGKGLVVDWLASQDSSSLVIRSNGGAQAAHTVQTPDGRRHVFHHIGSGTFAGAATHLSRFMIINPIVFNHERIDLAKLGETPIVSVDPSAEVTTPFDMLINQMIEFKRGADRHGSCGLGIGETIERGEKSIRLTVADLERLNLSELRVIRNEWVEKRLNALGLINTDEMFDFLFDDRILEAYLGDVETFLKYSTVRCDSSLGNEKLIFEGAQGLLLDQTYGRFPHVTRSNTGLTNIVALLNLMKVKELDAYYVMRAYQTRHGAGPMKHEQDISAHFDLHDPTNVPNQWQGTLRHGLIDQQETNDIIARDHAADWVTSHRVMTCLDQAKGMIQLIINGKVEELSEEDAMAAMGCMIGSRGPTRDTLFHGVATNNSSDVLVKDKAYI